MQDNTKRIITSGSAIALAIACAILSAQCAWWQKNHETVIKLGEDACLALTESDDSKEAKTVREICATERELRPYVEPILQKRASVAVSASASANVPSLNK